MIHELIVYACPLGALHDQLKHYFQQSRLSCSPNTAHKYMPHCTLTGFFHDEAIALPLYIQAISDALYKQWQTMPDPVLSITAMDFDPHFHYLKLESPWLNALMIDFAKIAHSPTRIDDLRLKDWLHLSLAYGFEADCHQTLRRLATEIIDPMAPVEWVLRLYERYPNNKWRCHQEWALKRQAQLA